MSKKYLFDLTKVIVVIGYHLLVVFPLVVSAETNYMPETPELTGPADQATVSLTPDLTTTAFSDANGDSHSQTRYQIALDTAFTDLVFDQTFYEYLTELPLMDLVLAPETTYYWRVKFINIKGGESLWSASSSFTTINYAGSGDGDANGILDNQEVVDMTVDLDENHVSDADQSDLMCVATNDIINPYVSVMGGGSEIHLVGLRSLTSDDIGRALNVNKPDILTRLISFKVSLEDGLTTADITMYFSAEVPEGATHYYYTEDGWVASSNAVFSSDRRSVTITLEDGGDGDQDGVVNGVIVYPAALGYSSQMGLSSSYEITEQTTCFITTTLFGY